jgi:inner membrane protein
LYCLLQYHVNEKIIRLYITCFLATLPYSIFIGIAYNLIEIKNNYFLAFFIALTTLFACSSLSIFIINKKINNYFSSFQNNHFMQENQFENATENSSNNATQPNNWRATNPEPNTSNKILIKGAITGALILLMLIPTVFVDNLVKERQQRQQDVVKEVKQGWATEQTVYGPYLYIPYVAKEKDKDNKEVIINKHFYALPQDLNITTNIAPEERKRSIYKVLLYKSDIKSEGKFNIKIPADIDVNSLQLSNAKICFGVTDLKGIEEKLNVTFNGKQYDLSAGLPTKNIETVTENTNTGEEVARTENQTKQIELIGLSSNIDLTITDFEKPLTFNTQLKLKGSEQLHFIPLSANSSYTIASTWANPKFDGSNLPNARDVNDSGFVAKWNFNSANLPFTTIVKDFNFSKFNYAFGVSMLQPTDQYSKTNRSIKYAILFIGLTFALFFIIELMQKKPVHPVQYVLIGIALVIFFTLLLSISEFLMFDAAYCIAAAATVLLITFYAKAHFKSVKTASVFGLFLSCLYTFIFVLIRLEDAALLFGSIGLFVILAFTMFGSRKINWYGERSISQ